MRQIKKLYPIRIEKCQNTIITLNEELINLENELDYIKSKYKYKQKEIDEQKRLICESKEILEYQEKNELNLDNNIFWDKNKWEKNFGYLRKWEKNFGYLRKYEE